VPDGGIRVAGAGVVEVEGAEEDVVGAGERGPRAPARRA
jgi:hypothetical protein